MRILSFLLIATLSASFSGAFGQSHPGIFAGQSHPGIFASQSDVGPVLHQGSTSYDSENQTYQLSGSGSNVWFKSDEFHYVYRKIKGDFILQARGQLIGRGVEAHRKFGWMVRSSLDTNSAMAAAVVHGDGLTSLQFRRQTDINVEEDRSSLQHADFIQLERKGNLYIMSVAKNGGLFVVSEQDSLQLGDEVYVGLFICSHNKDVVEKVKFDNVRIIKPAPPGWVPYKDYLGSSIEILDVKSRARKVIFQDSGSVQAPNWTPDNQWLIYNSKGHLYKLDLTNHQAQLFPTGSVTANNNDHVLAFGGKKIALSSALPNSPNSLVWTMPISGAEPQQLTPIGPSYAHGWSPDGNTIVFTGQRHGDFDIYSIPSKGGPETQLTHSPGLDDGPEYNPDGKWIYFNSVRSGNMQIWRMHPDGSGPEQITHDTLNNWFPHISPDGKYIVYIAFLPSETKPDDHPFYRHVYLMLMRCPSSTSGNQASATNAQTSPAGSANPTGPTDPAHPADPAGTTKSAGPADPARPQVLAYVYGGQGTINTPSWSPDSEHIAFVSNSGDLDKP
jgi:TolB protein